METMISIGIGVISVCAIFVTIPQIIDMSKYNKLEKRVRELEQLTEHLRREKEYIEQKLASKKQ